MHWDGVDFAANAQIRLFDDDMEYVLGMVENSENELKEIVSQDATIEIGGKLSEKTGDSKMISDGDYFVKCEGKALMQGATDARISKG